MMEWNNATRSDHIVGLALCILWTGVLMSNSESVGIPRDESFYLYAADRTADWYERLGDPAVRSFSKKEIDRGFKYNHEHPVLMKTLFGLSHRFLHERFGWIKQGLTAYRFPTMLMAGLSLWLAWLLGIMLRNRLVGLMAALALAFMPRVFFHSHLACFDAPVTFMWLAGVYTFIRASRSRRWSVVAGVTLGLGLATKLNVFFLPFTLLCVAIVDVYCFRAQTGRLTVEGEGRGPLTYYCWIAISMVVLGLVVFFVHWPWLYYETIPRLRFYVGFHARHVHYPVDYLGHLFYRPPFPVHFPFVMTLFTVPAGTILLALIGVAVLVRRAVTIKEMSRARRVLELTIMANLLVPILVIALPNTPIFGGTKHWMPAMPFFALCAGLGLAHLVDRLAPDLSPFARTRMGYVVGLIMLTPAAWATANYGDHGPAYFNGLVGGPPGAAALGLPRNFWGYSTVAVLPTINEKTGKRPYVFWHKATKGSIDAYKSNGLLKKDVRYTGDWTAEFSDWAVYHDQMEKQPEELDVWRAYGRDWPVDGHFIDGVQIMSVYQKQGRPKKARPPQKSGQ